MAKEIERKFLLDQMPEQISGIIPKTLEQGYLALDPEGKEVRLRKSDTQFWLTVKSKGQMVREEYEINLSKEQFDQLWPATKGRRLRKDRYELSYEGLIVEIDVYHKPLKGLKVAEVEFPSEKEADKFEKADWMGAEVTHLSFLKNKRLLEFDSFDSLKGLL